mmetsp:Transcript_79574/g.227191  ORF Transcript_79574/g.227191 Transcript_79574/m.227191 type:complete len:445 (-) Transcript_79574:134-1468(-)
MIDLYLRGTGGHLHIVGLVARASRLGHHLGLVVEALGKHTHVVVNRIVAERVLQRGRNLKDAVTDGGEEQRREEAGAVHEERGLFQFAINACAPDFIHGNDWDQEAEDEVEHVEQMLVRHRHLGGDDASGALEEVHDPLGVEDSTVEEVARVRRKNLLAQLAAEHVNLRLHRRRPHPETNAAVEVPLSRVDHVGDGRGARVLVPVLIGNGPAGFEVVSARTSVEATLRREALVRLTGHVALECEHKVEFTTDNLAKSLGPLERHGVLVLERERIDGLGKLTGMVAHAAELLTALDEITIAGALHENEKEEENRADDAWVNVGWKAILLPEVLRQPLRGIPGVELVCVVHDGHNSSPDSHETQLRPHIRKHRAVVFEDVQEKRNLGVLIELLGRSLLGWHGRRLLGREGDEGGLLFEESEHGRVGLLDDRLHELDRLLLHRRSFS